MEKIKMTKKEIARIAGSRPILSAGYDVGCYLEEKGFQPIGYGCGNFGWNFDVYEIGDAIVCAGYRPGNWDGEIVKSITNNDYSKKSIAQVLASLASSIEVKKGYKSWGWLAKAVFEARFLGKETLGRVEFRPYHAYKGNYARLSYSKIPEGLTEACEKLGIVAIKGNDAPRGGQRGDYIRFAFKDEKIVLDEKKGERI